MPMAQLPDWELLTLAEIERRTDVRDRRLGWGIYKTKENQSA
jgi:hypothetical protein